MECDDGGGFCASGCDACGCLSFNSAWFNAFGVLLCDSCRRDAKLISKGNAKTAYLLTDRDLSKLGTLEKPNPQHPKWKPMQLYLQTQVEEVAEKKHGSVEDLERMRQDRLEARLEGRMKKRAAEEQLRQRAEEGGGDEEDDGARPRLENAAQQRMRQRLEATHGGHGAPAARQPTVAAAAAGAASGQVEAEGVDVEEI